MTKMSREERQSRRDKVAADALESVAKSEQFNFRVDADTIKRLYAIAGAQRKPVGAMVREWILDRLEEEQKSPSPTELLKEIHSFHRETVACLRALIQNSAAAPISQATAPTEAPGLMVEEASQPKSWGPGPSSPLRVAESTAPSLPYPVPFPKMPEISNSELFMVLSRLQPVKPGCYELPDWMVEYLKDQLQAR